MSKRSRGGEILVSSMPIMHIGTKRPSSVVEPAHYAKRYRMDTFELVQNSRRGMKRMALFDDELHNVHKRMRAAVPTAEEALAVIIPHLMSLRRLLLESETKNQDLLTHLRTLGTAYEKEVMEKRQLQRQLESAQYRFALVAPRPDAV